MYIGAAAATVEQNKEEARASQNNKQKAIAPPRMKGVRRKPPQRH